MNAKFDQEAIDRGVSACACHSESQSRQPSRGMLKVAAAFLLVVVHSGCATSNYDFDALSELGDQPRVARLSEAWLLESDGESAEGLYDVDVIPLAHTSLNVFAKADDEGIPEGFVEADIDAYLPFFGFLDLSIKRYDSAHRMYEQQEYNSYLWGLFQTQRELIDTSVGTREVKRRRFLWFFGWKSSPKYTDATSRPLKKAALSSSAPQPGIFMSPT